MGRGGGQDGGRDGGGRGPARGGERHPRYGRPGGEAQRGERPRPEGGRPTGQRGGSGGDRYEARGVAGSRERRGERPYGKPSPRFAGRGESRFSRPERTDRPERGERRDRLERREPGERRPEGRRFEPGAGRPERTNRFQGAPRPARPGDDRSSSRFGGGASGGSRYGKPDRFSERGPVGGSEAASGGESESFGGDTPADLIWGRHSAQATLESGRPIHRIWCTPEMRFSPKFLQLLREAKAGGVLVEEVTWARLGQITGGAVHQGIVLQTAAADTLDLPTLIDGCRQLGEPPLLMALDGITDPHNLGAIARSAEALGAHGLVLPQRRSAGLTGSVAKVAAGALEHLPVARVVNLNRALDALKQEGYRVVGLAGEGSVTLEEADLDGPLVIVTGSESDGLSMLTRRSCDQVVRIPLRGATPSLNASVATALMLYEVARRGWMQKVLGSSPAPRIVRPALPSPAAAAPEAPAAEHGIAGPAEEEAPVLLEDTEAASAAAEAAEAAEVEPVEGERSELEAAEPEALEPEASAPVALEPEAEPTAPEAGAPIEEPLPEANPDPGADTVSPIASPWEATPYGTAAFDGDIRL